MKSQKREIILEKKVVNSANAAKKSKGREFEKKLLNLAIETDGYIKENS